MKRTTAALAALFLLTSAPSRAAGPLPAAPLVPPAPQVAPAIFGAPQRYESFLRWYEAFLREQAARTAKNEAALAEVEGRANELVKNAGLRPAPLEPLGHGAELLRQAEEVRRLRERLFPPKPPAEKKG